MATEAGRGLDLSGLDRVHWAAVVLAGATGLLHLYIGVVDTRLPLVLAGLGFLGGVGVFLAGARDRRLYLAAIAYTAVQVVAWAVVNAGAYTAVGYADKAVQVALIGVLVVLARRG